MTRIRRLLVLPVAALGALRDASARVIGVLALALTPETGEEAAVMLGLLGVAAMFLMRGQPELAVGVPGALLVAIGLGFNLRRGS